MIISILLILLGFVFLIKGADFLVDGARDIALKFHIPEIIIGLTIVSIGTSMPELFVSISSALSGYSDMAIGNAIGSNLCNVFLILGLSAIIRPIKFQRETRLIEAPLCMAITIIFAYICNSDLMISRKEAFILIGLFILFIIYTIVMSFEGKKFDKEDDNDEIIASKNNIPIIRSIINIIIGMVALKIGGDLTVNNAVIVAEKLNISEKIISLTILALGTSLPELVTSATAAFKGDSDIAVGNIIGSNIFNMLLIIGVSSFIKPIVYNITYNLDMIILTWGVLLLMLFPIIPPKNRMNRLNGFMYLSIYILYMSLTIFVF